MVNNVYDVTSAGKADAPAIGAPGRPWLSYAGLKKLTDDTLAALNGVGIGRGDRVAMVAPNGPEMASSFIAVTVNRGSFGSSDTAYLYVVDSAGAINSSGLQITFGGSGGGTVATTATGGAISGGGTLR